VVVGAKLEKSRMEVHRIAAPLEHGRAKIVVEKMAHDTPELREGAHVAAQEVLQALVEEELQREGPRVGEGDLME
jgi:hypothetical protein